MTYKDYEIKLEKAATAYSIHSVGRGALPKDLSGLFTSRTYAQKQIDAYLEKKVTTKE